MGRGEDWAGEVVCWPWALLRCSGQEGREARKRGRGFLLKKLFLFSFQNCFVNWFKIV
jgi:hypothetical protein